VLRTVTREVPVRGHGDVHFVIKINPGEETAAAALLRMQYPGAEVKTEPSGFIYMRRGGYKGVWLAITATDVEAVVTGMSQRHIVLAPDPHNIDAIRMRTTWVLGSPQTRALVELGLTVYPLRVPDGDYPGFLYRLVPQVGNPWPTRDEIAAALEASHSSPPEAHKW